MILALSLGGLLKNTQACAFDCEGSSQIFCLDDGDGDDGEACILPATALAAMPIPAHRRAGPYVRFVASLKTPPAKPPPIPPES